jgi:hypothetical protein
MMAGIKTTEDLAGAFNTRMQKPRDIDCSEQLIAFGAGSRLAAEDVLTFRTK